MTRKFLTVLFWVCAAMFGVIRMVQAQVLQQATAPTILSFTSDVPSITLESAEAGNITLTLSWQVLNLGGTQRLALETYKINSWVTVIASDEVLAANGSRAVIIQHPLNFGPPTYRLSIRDASGQILDERTVAIPYDTAQQLVPKIISFSPSVSNVDAAALAQKTARVGVTWQVSHRPPMSNLVFEQVLDDGSAVSVELPRDSVWVASMGAGEVAPVSPGSSPAIKLRLRVVDVTSGQVYDEATFSLPIVQPAATLPPTVTPSAGAPRVVFFTVSPNPADPTGTVMLSWQVSGASFVYLEWLDKQINSIEKPFQPLSGTLNVSLADVSFSQATAQFNLYATDASGNFVQNPPGTNVFASVVVQLTTDMHIDTFVVTPNPVARQGTLTVQWSVPNARAVKLIRTVPSEKYVRLTDAFVHDPNWDNLPSMGSVSVTLSDDYTTTVSFTLTAEDKNGIILTQNLTVNIVCPFASFLAPFCPLTQTASVNMAYQTYERGAMLWRSDTQEIFVLYNDGTYTKYPDTWTSGEAVTVPDAPPAGLIVPQRGFGKLWVNQAGVRDKLGWATSSEASYATLLETVYEGQQTGMYLRLPDGRTVHIAANRFWQVQ